MGHFIYIFAGVKKQVAKYLVVVWLAALLLLGNLPMDFIHQFADHEDTVHKDHHGLVIEKQHHHCAYLSLTLASFVNDFNIPFVEFVAPTVFFTKKQAVISHNYIQRCIIAVALRGPPLA